MGTEIIPLDAALPDMRRAQRLPERPLYVARAGLGALPSGIGAALLIVTPQFLSLGFLLWAIWWPAPITPQTRAFALLCTWLLGATVVVVGWALTRRFRGFVSAVLRAPFTRITVTDQRVIWSLPWARRPLMEISRHRIQGALLGHVDRRGRGSAAMMLFDGDPAADIDGNIHFDKLPHAEAFVRALTA